MEARSSSSSPVALCSTRKSADLSSSRAPSRSHRPMRSKGSSRLVYVLVGDAPHFSPVFSPSRLLSPLASLRASSTCAASTQDLRLSRHPPSVGSEDLSRSAKVRCFLSRRIESDFLQFSPWTGPVSVLRRAQANAESVPTPSTSSGFTRFGLQVGLPRIEPRKFSNDTSPVATHPSFSQSPA